MKVFVIGIALFCITMFVIHVYSYEQRAMQLRWVESCRALEGTPILDFNKAICAKLETIEIDMHK